MARKKISYALLSISFVFLSIPIFVMMEFLYRNIIELNLANEKVDQTLVAPPIIDFAGSFASIATLLIVMLGIGILFFISSMYVRRHP